MDNEPGWVRNVTTQRYAVAFTPRATAGFQPEPLAASKEEPQRSWKSTGRFRSLFKHRGDGKCREAALFCGIQAFLNQDMRNSV